MRIHYTYSLHTCRVLWIGAFVAFEQLQLEHLRRGPSENLSTKLRGMVSCKDLQRYVEVRRKLFLRMDTKRFKWCDILQDVLWFEMGGWPR